MFVVVYVLVFELLGTKNHSHCDFVFLRFENFGHRLAVAPNVPFYVFQKVEFIKFKLVQLMQNTNFKVIYKSTILSIRYVTLINFINCP